MNTNVEGNIIHDTRCGQWTSWQGFDAYKVHAGINAQVEFVLAGLTALGRQSVGNPYMKTITRAYSKQGRTLARVGNTAGFQS